MARRRPRGRREGRLRRFVRRLFLAVGTTVALVALAAGSLIYREIQKTLPPIDTVVDYRPPVATQIFASNGALIGELFSEKRYLVPIDRVPELVRQAFLAAEDADFYRHKGVDLVGILRATINNLAAGGKVQGGSTITQQVVKSVLLSPKKSYERKVKEILLSVRLERQLPKDKILELYLNHIYFGSGAYGVAAAAREYFGKDVADLSVAEAALLAGLPKAPSRYSPFRRWPRAKARQRYVLNRMYEAGFIGREERDAALRQPLSLATRKGSFRAASYFVEEVRRTMEARYGRTGLYELGLRIYTTVDLGMQKAAEEALRRGLEEVSARNGNYRSVFRRMDAGERGLYLRQQKAAVRSLEPSGTYEGIVTSVRQDGARIQVGGFTGDLVPDPQEPEPLPKLDLNDLLRVRVLDPDSEPPQFTLDPAPSIEGALVALDPRTGHVKALVGGYDFGRSQFNRATQARRQPGSAFKPLIYAAALDRNFKPTSIIIDAPVYYNDNGRVWSPKNFEKKYFGPTSLREALTKSRNVVTVKLAHAVGVRYLVDYLNRFGFPTPMPRNLSIALGSTEVTPLELAAAYAAFANNGARPLPILITEVTAPNGAVIEDNEPILEAIMPARTAYTITSMLQDVVQRGTGRRAHGLDQPTAGKTGTTNDLNDAWFVGYTPELLAAVWVGFDSKRPIGPKETGGVVAAPIWKAFMDEAVRGLPRKEFPVPGDLRCADGVGLRSVSVNGMILECPPLEPPSAPLPIDEGEVQVQTLPASEPPREKSSSLDFLRNDF
jgi:penicillin-binding protein 1A